MTAELSSAERDELHRLRSDCAAYGGLLQQSEKQLAMLRAQYESEKLAMGMHRRRLAEVKSELERVTDRLEAMLLSLTFGDGGRGGFDANIVANTWPEWQGAHARVHAIAQNRVKGVNLG